MNTPSPGGVVSVAPMNLPARIGWPVVGSACVHAAKKSLPFDAADIHDTLDFNVAMTSGASSMSVPSFATRRAITSSGGGAKIPL